MSASGKDLGPLLSYYFPIDREESVHMAGRRGFHIEDDWLGCIAGLLILAAINVATMLLAR